MDLFKNPMVGSLAWRSFSWVCDEAGTEMAYSYLLTWLHVFATFFFRAKLLMMLAPLLLSIVLPKMMENMDPEERKEV